MYTYVNDTFADKDVQEVFCCPTMVLLFYTIFNSKTDNAFRVVIDYTNLRSLYAKALSIFLVLRHLKNTALLLSKSFIYALWIQTYLQNNAHKQTLILKIHNDIHKLTYINTFCGVQYFDINSCQLNNYFLV